MKNKVFKIIMTLSVLGALSITGFASAMEGYGGHGNDNKVEVCHNGNTIEIASAAVATHLAHGDVVGECKESKKGGDDEKENKSNHGVSDVVHNIVAFFQQHFSGFRFHA